MATELLSSEIEPVIDYFFMTEAPKEEAVKEEEAKGDAQEDAKDEVKGEESKEEEAKEEDEKKEPATTLSEEPSSPNLEDEPKTLEPVISVNHFNIHRDHLEQLKLRNFQNQKVH